MSNARNRVWQRIVLVVLAMGSTVLAASVAPTDSVPVGAKTWVESRSVADLAKLSEAASLTRLPMEYRRVVLNAATPTRRAEIWRAVFDEFAQTHSLSTDQAKLLSETKALIVPEIFAGVRTYAVDDPILVAQAAVRKSLGFDAARVLFGGPGPVKGAGSALPLAERAKYEWRQARLTFPKAIFALIAPIVGAVPGDCQCNDADNDCWLSTCDHSDSCTASEWGCGPWWLYACNGMCRPL